MRVLLVLAFILARIMPGNCQVLISLLLGDKLNSGKIEFGLDGGANFPLIKGLSEGEMRAGFNLGFYFDISLKNPQWMIHTGVLVKSSMGSSGLPVYPLNDPDLDNVFADGAVQRKINYFNVPIAMKYKFRNNIYVEGGIMPALRAKAFDIFTAKVIDKEDLQYKADIRDQIHPLDFGLIGGIGYRLMGGNGMNLTLRYYYGIVDIVIDDSTPNQYNTSLYLSAGIPIGAGKAKAKRE
ncbi:MAG TPA: porin family protein, partial [Cyclobacteriaceae bacterium]|nr:porin family protein [Cyclobacteriaceae bacterium]